MSRKKLMAGNWKMNKTAADAAALIKDIAFNVGQRGDVDVVVCPPFTALETAAAALEGSVVKLGAQNMHPEASGAYTGEISAPMLRSLFVTHVILGHSERRTYFGETNAFINLKLLAALKNQLRPILCVGESLAEREAATTLKVIQGQVERGLEGVSKELAPSIVVAYEPVWAIGTGKTASPGQAQAVHEFIRERVAKHDLDVAANMRILYGGSVNAANAAQLFAKPDIDGGLIGSASLVADEFVAICKAANQAPGSKKRV